MGNNIALHEYIGDPIQAVTPASLTTDFAVSSDYEIPIDGYKGVLFLMNFATMAAGTVDGVVYYSSTGKSSDASIDSDIWASTNAVWAQLTSDSSAGIYGLNVDLGSKGLSGGNLYVKLENVGAQDVGVIAIPYGGNLSLPCTNANTIVNAV